MSERTGEPQAYLAAAVVVARLPPPETQRVASEEQAAQERLVPLTVQQQDAAVVAAVEESPPVRRGQMVGEMEVQQVSLALMEQPTQAAVAAEGAAVVVLTAAPA